MTMKIGLGMHTSIDATGYEKLGLPVLAIVKSKNKQKNVKADFLATRGSNTQSLGPETFCGVSKCVIYLKIKKCGT